MLMYEILKHEFFQNESEHFVQIDGKNYIIYFKFDLEETYSHQFNPGSLYGHYEKYSGMQPVDVVFLEIGLNENGYQKLEDFNSEDFDKLLEELEQYILENYDYD